MKLAMFNIWFKIKVYILLFTHLCVEQVPNEESNENSQVYLIFAFYLTHSALSYRNSIQKAITLTMPHPTPL